MRRGGVRPAPPEFVAGGEGGDEETQQIAERTQAQEAGGGLRTCCASYKIGWLPVGFAPGDIVTLKRFSVGDDSWGPYAGYQIPNAPNQPVTQAHEAQVCKEGADCEELKIGKLEFEKRGGGGPVGQTIALGTIGDINVCKLK